MNTEHPSKQIQKLRLKEERRKKISRVLLYIITAMLIFCIGFCSGLLYVAKRSIDRKTEVMSDNIINSASAEANEESLKESINAKTKYENAKLNELKPKLAAIIKDKYPDADLSFAVKNLDTGAYMEYDNKRMNSASLIKLFILETVYDEMAKGTYKLTADKEKELEIMITESKNSSANLFIDDFGGDNDIHKVTEQNLINQNILKRGYKHTELNRKMFDKTPPWGVTGFNNYTSPSDVCRFFEGIFKGTQFDDPYNEKALNYLKSQTRRGKIPSKITGQYPDITVANKTGELANVENDAAIIMCSDFNIAFAVMIDRLPPNTPKAEVHSAIGDMALKLVEFYKK